MTSTETTATIASYIGSDLRNPRFTELRTIAGLGTEGRYEVRSVGITGRYNIIGRTDDVALVCEATEVLTPHATHCETFTAHEAIGTFD